MGRTCAERLVGGQETHKCGQDSGLGGARAWWGQVSCVGRHSLMKGWGREPGLNPLEEATRKRLVALVGPGHVADLFRMKARHVADLFRMKAPEARILL